MPKRMENKLSKAQAAACVHRMVAKRDDKGRIVHDDQGNPVPVPAKVSEAEVMSWAEYDDGRIVVVTTAGEKLEGVHANGAKSESKTDAKK